MGSKYMRVSLSESPALAIFAMTIILFDRSEDFEEARRILKESVVVTIYPYIIRTTMDIPDILSKGAPGALYSTTPQEAVLSKYPESVQTYVGSTTTPISIEAPRDGFRDPYLQ